MQHETSYTLSPYIHIFKKDGIFCYYHSITSKTIYLTQEQHNLLENDLCNNGLGQKDNLLKTFIKNDFIHTKDKHEENLLDGIKKNIPKPQITISYFILTEACNLACSYCFLGNGDLSKNNCNKALDFETAEKSLIFFIKQSILSGVNNQTRREIIFYGGEPLLNFKTLQRTVQLYKKFRNTNFCPFEISFSVVTNGTLITPEIAKFFADNKINISISLDGPTFFANQNRIFRSSTNPAFYKILEGIDLLKKYNCIFGLSMTLTENALKTSPEELLLFFEEKKINAVSFNTLICDKMIKQNTYYEKAAEYIINFWKKARILGIVEDRISRKIKAFATRQFLYADCAAVAGGQICFYPNGDIRICHGCKKGEQNTSWNVFTVPDKINLNNSREIQDWTNNSPIFYHKCINCYAISVCGGGCIINKKANLEDMNIDFGFCIQTKKILEFLVWDLYEKMTRS